MGSESEKAVKFRRHHLVAMPYPGRGHVNPMFNLCSLLLSSHSDLLISFVVTEEWLGLLRFEYHHPPPNFRFVAVPQVIPSELGRANNLAAFYDAVHTKLLDPFERLLDRLEPPPTAIICDTFLGDWVFGVGQRRNIPVASLFTQSATLLSIFVHFDLMNQHGHSLIDLDVSGRETEVVDYIPGIPSTTLGDLPFISPEVGKVILPRAFKAFSTLSKTKCILLPSIHEIEEQVINVLKANLPIPIYPIGPVIPYLKLESDGIYKGRAKDNSSLDNQGYFQWLDSQPPESVLYISQGSFLSISDAQMEEIIAGIKESEVRFLWVTRGGCCRFKDGVGEMGCLVPWCDQLKVLCHPSVGGFWTHCGWNSTSEGIYAGVPMITCPMYWDQIPNCKSIVSDWKVGRRVINNKCKESLVTRNEIALLLRNFMDPNGIERKEMVIRAKRIREICKRAVTNGGSAASNFIDFTYMFLNNGM